MDFDFRFYLTLLLRRLHYVIFFLAVGSILGVTVALILPPRFYAEALLVVESQQIPDELASSTVRTGATEQLQIIRQQLLSRNTLLDLADQFGVYAGEEGAARSPDEIVSDMRTRININTRGGGWRSNDPVFIRVGFSADTAPLSAAVANQIVTLILAEDVEMRTTTTGQTLDFFEREVERLDAALSERSARISAFQQGNREALPDSLQFRRSQLVALQERLVDIARERAQLEDRREDLELLFERTGGRSLENEAQMSPEARELQGLRNAYTAQAAVLSEQNPRQVTLRRRIEALEAVVADQEAAAVDEEGEPMSAYDLQIADIDEQIEFLDLRATQIEENIETLDRTIGATPNNAITLARLERDLENVRRQYDQAVANRARAETGDTIEALSKGQRISIIETAVPPGGPNSPDRRKIAITGIGGGLMAGLGLVALLELLNTSVRRGVEIERALDITPIATLSYIRTHAEVMRRRALIAGAFGVAVLGLPAGLWGVHTYYMPIDMVAQQVIDRLPEIPVLSDALRRIS
jgi:uncharacterized protein involved in exopolysaccharide biosynthesis